MFSFIALYPYLPSKLKTLEKGDLSAILVLLTGGLILGSGLNHDLFGGVFLFEGPGLLKVLPQLTIFCLAGIVFNSGIFIMLMGIRKVRHQPVTSPKIAGGFFQIITIINFIASVLGIIAFYLQYFERTG